MVRGNHIAINILFLIDHPNWAKYDALFFCGQIITMMRTMYQKCKLVHGDLSEYNILYFEVNDLIYGIKVLSWHMFQDHTADLSLQLKIEWFVDFGRGTSTSLMFHSLSISTTQVR